MVPLWGMKLCPWLFFFCIDCCHRRSPLSWWLKQCPVNSHTQETKLFYDALAMVLVLATYSSVTNYPRTQPFQWQTCITSRVLYFWLRVSHWTTIELSSGTAVTSRLDWGRNPFQVHTLKCWRDSVPPGLSGLRVSGPGWLLAGEMPQFLTV